MGGITPDGYQQQQEQLSDCIEGECELVDEPKQRCSAFFGLGDPAMDEIICEYVSRAYGNNE